MKKIVYSAVAIATAFFVVIVGSQVNAEDSPESNLIVKGTILKADGTAYSSDDQPYVRFTPINPENPAEPWRDQFDLVTGVGGLGKSEFSSTIFSWLKIKKLKYTAIAHHRLVIGNGSSQATQEIDSEPQTIDLTDATGTIDLQFQFQYPHKYISGTIVDDEGNPIAGQYDATNRLYNVRASIIVEYPTTPRSDSLGYSVMPDAQGRFSVAVANHGGSYKISSYSDTSDKYLRNIGYQAEGSFADDTSDETVTVQLTMIRTGDNTLLGRIVDKKGEPFGGVIETNKIKQWVVVYADSTTSSTGQYMNVGSDGRFTLKLRDGSFRFYIMASKYNGNEPGAYINYPPFAIDLQAGQTIDLGDIKPVKMIEDNPSSPNAPQVINVARNQALRAQTKSSVKIAAFSETFTDQQYFNASASSGVKWTTTGLTISSSVSAQSTTTTAGSGTAISKWFGPRGGRITSVTLFDVKNITGGTVQYFVSVDEANWLNVSPGKKTPIPSSWDTKNGLKWKAVLQKASSSDTVKLTGLKFEYTFLPGLKKPIIRSTTVKVSGGKTQITIRGKNLTKTPTVYIGSKKISVLKVSGDKVTATIQRSKFPKASYAITVVTPDLQSTVKTKIKIHNSD